MEVIKTKLKAIAWFLTALLLFQSCVVYHKTPTTLEKASQEQIQTKVTFTKDEVAKYKYIKYDNGVYHGVNHISGKLVSTPLSEDEIEKVVIKDRSASTLATVFLIVIPAGVIVFAISSCANNPFCPL